MKVEFVTHLNDYASDSKMKIFSLMLKNKALSFNSCSETVGYFHKKPDNSGFEHRTSWNLL